MSYFPPSSPIAFTFDSGGYTPPSMPLAFVWAVGGEQVVLASGIGSAQFGAPTATNVNQQVSASGIDDLSFGPVTVYEVAGPSYLTGFGFRSDLFGATVARYNQTMSPESIGDAAVIAKPRVAPSIRLRFVREAVPNASPLIFNFELGPDVLGIYPSSIGPAGTGVVVAYNVAGDFRPQGIDSARFTAPIVYNETQVVGAFGLLTLALGDVRFLVEQRVFGGALSAARYGVASVYNLDAFIPVSGFVASQFGGTVVENRNKTIFVDGRNLGAVGEPVEVKTFINFLSPEGIAPPANQVPGVFVAFDIQYARPAPVPGPLFGVAKATLKNQQIAPFPFTSFQPGPEPFVSFKVRELRPPGNASTLIPLHRVFDPAQRAFPPSMSSLAMGPVSVSNRNRTLVMPTIIATGMSPPQVFNKNQIIYQPFTSFPTGGEIGPIDIRNRNRELYAEGINSLRMRPFHEARLVAEAVSPEGIGVGAVGSATVSNFIRQLAVPGFDSYSGTLSRVIRAALDFRATGFSSQSFGSAQLIDGEVELFIQTPVQTAFGTPFASISPITLTEVEAINESAIGAHAASVSPLLVEPLWTLSEVIGAVSMTARINAIEPRTVPPTLFGEVAVSNRNRRLNLPSVVEDRPPTPRIFNKVQIISDASLSPLAFGLHNVRDKTSRITFGGVVPPNPSRFATFLKFPPDPPGSQQIVPIPIEGAFGGAVLDDRAIRPDGLPPGAFGSTVVRTNTILPVGIFEDFTAETNHFIPSAQFIRLPEQGESDGHGKPQTQHLTIWATEDTLPQAIANHPQGDIYHVVDYYVTPLPGPGTPRVSNRVRYLSPAGIDSSSQSTGHVFANELQYVFPAGFDSRRVMAPKFPNAEPARPQGFEAAEYGTPLVDHYVAPGTTLYVRPLGSDATYGTAWVSNWIRNLSPSGFVASRFSFALVSLELPPIVRLGFSAAEFGDALVDYRIRTRTLDGFDAALFGPSLGDFARRMRVTARARAIPTGVLGSQMGAPSVSLSSRGIGPDGFRSEIVFAPRIQSVIRTAGTSTATFGSPLIEVSEPGVIKGRGIADGELGAPRLTMQVRATSITGAQGSVRFAIPILPLGIASGSAGAAVAVGEDTGHTCGMAPRGVAVAGSSMTGYGAATVG